MILLPEQPKDLTKTVGTMYFGITLLALEDWWLAADADGTINQYRNEPRWCPDIEEWTVPDEQYHKVAVVDMEGTCPTKTKMLVKEFKRDPERRYSSCDHSEKVKQQALMIQAIVGRPAVDQKLTNKEYTQKLHLLEKDNEWNYFFSDVLPVLAASCWYQWSWVGNSRQKYTGIEVRVDMRDLGCIIRDRDGNRVLPQLFAFQHNHERREERREEALAKSKPDT